MPSKKKEQPADAIETQDTAVQDDSSAGPALEEEIANLLEAAFNGDGENNDGALLLKEGEEGVPPVDDVQPEDTQLPEIELEPEGDTIQDGDYAGKPAEKKPAAKKRKKADDATVDAASPDVPADDDASRPSGDGAPPQEAPLYQTEPGDAQDDEAPEDAVGDEMPAANMPPAENALTPASETPAPRARRAPRRKRVDLNVLTLEANTDVETPEDREELVWHEINNSFRTRRIMTWTLDGVEELENRHSVGIVEYKGTRIAIPMQEMVISLGDIAAWPGESPEAAQNRILKSMMHSKIDFVVLGIDPKKRTVVASRRLAMLKKRQVFFMNKDYDGRPKIYEGRVVQARVLTVANKRIFVEIFGVECYIMARDLAWEWIGTAHERFSVGDTILVRVNEISIASLEKIKISADVRTVSSPDGSKNLEKCKVQGKYAGTVTDVHRGIVLIRLSIGVNAIAHSCYDSRMPGKNDNVSFVVTHIDQDQNIAKGIITRIIKQNL